MKKLQTQTYLPKNLSLDINNIKSFSFSINNTYLIYDNKLLAWIPKTQNLYDDNLEYLSLSPISFSNYGSRKIRNIFCNNDVCHAITESGIIYSWGNDINHKGLLCFGEGVFHLRNPTLNKYLSSLNINFISLSENHGACLDYKKNLYTWGDDTFGQLGFNSDNNNICSVPKKIVLNDTFFVNKVQCGKFFTAGITSDGIGFKFGNKFNYDENNIMFINDIQIEKNFDKKKNNIVFFNLMKSDFDNINNIQSNFYGRMIDIFCGEELICFINSKGDLFIYSDFQGLYKIKLSVDDKDYYKTFDKESLMIENVKFVNKNFYAISQNGSIIYEFINYSYNNKSPNLFDYVQNEYEINENVQINLINQPYYVSALFFIMKCHEKEMRNIEDGKIKLFNKRKYNENHNNNNISDKYNFNSNENLCSVNSKLNITYKGNSKRMNKISNMLENIFDKKIENIANNTKTNYDNKINAFFLGKKRIELIKINFTNKKNIEFLFNEPINEIVNNDSNYFNNNHILNIPISEKYSNERNRSRTNIFEIENSLNEKENYNRAKSLSKVQFNLKNKKNDYEEKK